MPAISAAGRVGTRSGNQLQLEKEWYYPDSLGRLYGAVTELLGFRAGADEHKVQWLSASGDDRFAPLFREMICRFGAARCVVLRWPSPVRGRLQPEILSSVWGSGTAPRFRRRSRPSIARGLQKTVEETVLKLAGEGENLCLAGGLFYNALLVEFLERCGTWKNVFVQARRATPARRSARCITSGIRCGSHTRRADAGSLLLGPSYGQEEIKQVLENCKLRFHYLRSTDDLLATAVRMLGEHKIVAWMQGRMEFGPRALGNRSILASPLDPYSTENLNVFIKHREPFRKFAASVPAELAAEYFEAGPNARYLATVGRVRAEAPQDVRIRDSGP